MPRQLPCIAVPAIRQSSIDVDLTMALSLTANMIGECHRRVGISDDDIPSRYKTLEARLYEGCFQLESYQRIPLEVEGFLVRRVKSLNCELMTTELFELVRSQRYNTS